MSTQSELHDFVAREVIYCVSALVSDMAKDECASDDDVLNDVVQRPNGLRRGCASRWLDNRRQRDSIRQGVRD